FQFARSTRRSIAASSSPSIWVQDAFTAGSATVGNSSNKTSRWELSNLSVLSDGQHTFKWGVRLRDSINNDTSLNNFNGTFTFFAGAGPALDATNQHIPGPSHHPRALHLTHRHS